MNKEGKTENWGKVDFPDLAEMGCLGYFAVVSPGRVWLLRGNFLLQFKQPRTEATTQWHFAVSKAGVIVLTELVRCPFTTNSQLLFPK